MTIQRNQSNLLGINPKVNPFEQALVNGEGSEVGLDAEQLEHIRLWGESLYSRVGLNPNRSAIAIGEKMGATVGVSSNPNGTENYHALAGELAYSPDPLDTKTRVIDTQIGDTISHVRDAWSEHVGADMNHAGDIEDDVRVRYAAERARKDMTGEDISESGAITFEDQRHVERAAIGRKLAQELLSGNTDALQELADDSARSVTQQVYELQQRYGDVEHMPNEDLARIGRYVETAPFKQANAAESQPETASVDDGNILALRAKINDIYQYDQDDFELAA